MRVKVVEDEYVVIIGGVMCEVLVVHEGDMDKRGTLCVFVV